MAVKYQYSVDCWLIVGRSAVPGHKKSSKSSTTVLRLSHLFIDPHSSSKGNQPKHDIDLPKD